MKKSGQYQYPMDSRMGPIDKLGGMVTRKSARKGIYSKSGSTANRHDQEALIDQIDKQVGRLLLKSSEIESKLDSIEGIKRTKYTKSQSSKPSKAKKTQSQEAQVPRKTQASSQPQQSDPTIQALFDLVQNLAKEVHIMHQEQTEMREEIRQLQDILVTEEEENVE